MKEIKEDLNQRRGITCSWIGRCNIVNMSILPKLIYRFNIIPFKSQQAFWVDKLIPKFIWKGKGALVRTGGDYTVRAQGTLGMRGCSVWHFVDGYMTLCICQNVQNCHQPADDTSCDTDCGDGGTYSVNMFKSIELYTLKGWSVWYVTYIRTKLLPRNTFFKTPEKLKKTKKKKTTSAERWSDNPVKPQSKRSRR